MAAQWNIEALKEHFEKVLAERDKAITAALQSAEKAVQVAEVNAERWRNQSNEWRGAMNDREKNFMPRSEFMAYKEAAEKAILKAQEKKETNMAQYIGWAVAIAVGVISYILK